MFLASQSGQLMYRIGDKDENDDYIWWNMNTKVFLFRLIGLYSLILGVLFVIGQIEHYVELRALMEQGAIIVEEPLHLEQIVLLLLANGSIFWLVIGGLLSFKKHSGVIAITLLITQIIVEFLSGFTVGMYFVPVTFVLVISLIGYDFINSGE
ncbi:MAG: hypothetical protein O8C64_11390 [Candidatus Methanoperedens sp.]|nr:hypothetical protein [Candidatus Methanoperedens sp.]